MCSIEDVMLKNIGEVVCVTCSIHVTKFKTEKNKNPKILVRIILCSKCPLYILLAYSIDKNKYS